MIGYHSTLAAFRTDKSDTEKTATILNALPGVSHNYLRDNYYNLWFTLTSPKRVDLKKKIAYLADEAGVGKWLYLPAVKTFGIGLKLKMGQGVSQSSQSDPSTLSTDITPDPVDTEFIRELQNDLPLTEEPFSHAAQVLGKSQENIVSQIENYLKQGVIRRVSAILHPVKAGYRANILVVWSVDQEHRDRFGSYAAAVPEVSHCYERLPNSGWPYSIYTMVHGCSADHCRGVIERIAREQKLEMYCELPTMKEYKKERVRYYETKNES
ncbi:transcriptional regulator AsnC family [Chitinispirillum alkaliphilum]|nr:transcriptional regulator AsnC family [Chitinispirillum alkaliphilum]